MRRFITLAIFASAVAALADDALPKAETILDKNIEVTGGKAYEKVRNAVATGTLELAGKGITGKITIYRAEPSRTYTVTELPGIGNLEEGVDGDLAWSNSAMMGPRIKAGAEKAQALRAARMHGELHWRETYKKAELAGIEAVNGKPCYKVVLTTDDGTQTRYFDKETNLVVKLLMTVKSPMGDVAAETYFEDFREESGIVSPRKIRQSAAGQEIVITFESLKYNVEMAKDRFDAPAPVKALLAKQK